MTPQSTSFSLLLQPAAFKIVMKQNQLQIYPNNTTATQVNSANAQQHNVKDRLNWEQPADLHIITAQKDAR